MVFMSLMSIRAALVRGRDERSSGGKKELGSNRPWLA
jgi:hypothetical protein